MYKFHIKYVDDVFDGDSDDDGTLIWKQGTLFIKGIDFAPEDVKTTFTEV